MSYFNSEQEAYMDYLRSVPARELCWCGWHPRKEKGFNPECDTHNKTAADKMAVWCPECHNDPGPNGKPPFTHRKGCSLETAEDRAYHESFFKKK